MMLITSRLWQIVAMEIAFHDVTGTAPFFLKWYQKLCYERKCANTRENQDVLLANTRTNSKEKKVFIFSANANA